MTEDELKEHISGGLWNPTSVEETPIVEMTRWSIREIQNGDLHIVGWNVTEGEGRVSSKIASFDRATSVATTRKGRQYHLPPDKSGINMQSEYVWQAWCRINKVEDWKDITEQYDENSIS